MLGSKRLAFPFVCELCTGLRAWLLPFSLSSLLPVELVGGLCCHYLLRVVLDKNKQLMKVAMYGSQEERGLRYRKIKV